MANFGEFIKEQRELKHWTQTEFAYKLGINASAVSRIEHNRKQVSASKLIKLSQLFEFNVDKIKELYYADKFAREAFKNGCPDTVFHVAEENVKYLKTKNTKQTNIKFD